MNTYNKNIRQNNVISKMASFFAIVAFCAFFAKLLPEMPLAELKRRTTFRGLNPLAERSVLVALQRRYKVLTDKGSKELSEYNP